MGSDVLVSSKTVRPIGYKVDDDGGFEWWS